MNQDQWFSIRDNSAPRGDNWQCLETFVVIAIGGVATDIQWQEARDAAKHPYNAQDSPYYKEFIQSIMSVVPHLTNSGLDNDHHQLLTSQKDPTVYLMIKVLKPLTN